MAARHRIGNGPSDMAWQTWAAMPYLANIALNFVTSIYAHLMVPQDLCELQEGSAYALSTVGLNQVHFWDHV